MTSDNLALSSCPMRNCGSGLARHIGRLADPAVGRIPAPGTSVHPRNHLGDRRAGIVDGCHSKWQERPLLVAVKRPGHEISGPALLDFLGAGMAKWWVPDDVVFVDEPPHTATGKLLKTKLREQYRNYRLPGA